MIESGMDWPPSAPEFRKLCLPEPSDYGLIEEDEAFQQAVGNRTEKAPETIYTLRCMGTESFTLKSEKEERSRRRWSKWYLQTLEDVAHGAKLPKPEEQIEEKPNPLDKETNLSNIQSLRGTFD